MDVATRKLNSSISYPKVNLMSTSSRSDAELVRSILASNNDDFKILMERYQQKIFAYLYRFLYQNEEAAMDITQDVFIKVYQNLASVDLERPLQPWIYRIAHNEAANYLRSVSRKKESQLEDDQWNSMSGKADTNQMEEEETKKLILQTLDKIDPKYREVLVLYFFEDKSYKDIADILDSTTNTVGTFISRGKKQMEKLLGQMSGFKDLLVNIIFIYLFLGINLPDQ